MSNNPVDDERIRINFRTKTGDDLQYSLFHRHAQKYTREVDIEKKYVDRIVKAIE
jgi:hypothetical protein